LKPSKVFSFAEYAKIAARHESDFSDFGTVVTQGNDNGNTYTFQDNGSDILGVAHVDTVQQGSEANLIKVNGGKVLLSPRLDDRLGVYIITRMLPALGVTCDWLLTTGEETGDSSAELFIAAKEYHWAFSFDRAGTDVVCYQHEHKALSRVLRKAGFKIGQGTFSDLSFLDVGCTGVNFGCGYHNPHSEHAYALLGETFYMVDLFQRFYRRHASERLPFKSESRYDVQSRYYGRSVYGNSKSYRYGETGYIGYTGYPEKNWTRSQNEYLRWYEVENVDQCDKCGRIAPCMYEGTWNICGDCAADLLAERQQYKDNGK
jgi:hypothetical protein